MNLSSLLKKTESKSAVDLNIFFDEQGVFIKHMKTKYPGFHRAKNYEKGHLKYHTHSPNENDFPINVNSIDEMYEEMRVAIVNMTGINFVLGMLSDEGQLQVWRRPNQPCQGGETRKYGCTHDDCTRPDDPRPGDLRYEFPDGKPLAIGVGIRGGNGQISDTNIPLFINPLSPYRRAYGVESNVEIVKKGIQNKGFLLLDADLVEPTMFVTLAKIIGGSGYSGLDLLDTFTLPEFFLIHKMSLGVNYGSITFGYHSHSDQDYVGNNNYINVRDFIKGGVEASTDLSGGVLGKRFDYNRPMLTEVFKKDGSNVYVGNILHKLKLDGSSVTTTKLNSMASSFREVIAEEIFRSTKKAA